MILDKYDDKGAYLHTVFGEDGIPPLLKTAANVSLETQKHAEDYAFVGGNAKTGRIYAYPLHDVGNAVASAIYFDKFASQHLNPELHAQVAKRIHGALEDFGLEPPEEITKSAAVSISVDPHAEDMLLEDLFGTDGMEVLSDHFDGCSPRGKQRLMLQVKEAGVKLASDQEAYGFDDLGTDLWAGVMSRKRLVLDESQLDRLDTILEKSASVKPHVTEEALHQFDIDNQLVHHYDSLVIDPILSVYGRTFEKSAEPVARVGDREMNSEDFTEAIGNHKERLMDVFGESMVEQLETDPVVVYNSLPMPEQQAISNILGD